jgi:uncharacterized protein
MPPTLTRDTLDLAGLSPRRHARRAAGIRACRRLIAGSDAVVGSTSEAAAEAGIPAVIAEAGGCGLVEEDAVRLHLDGLDGVLQALGMTDPGSDAAAPAPPEFLNRSVWLHCTGPGWWEPSVRPGDREAAS